MRTFLFAPISSALLLVGLLAMAVAMSGCAGQQPSGTAESRIVAACTQTGLFKMVNGQIAVAVKEARIPAAIVNAGLDRVCANPELVAGDAKAVEAVIQALQSVRPAS